MREALIAVIALAAVVWLVRTAYIAGYRRGMRDFRASLTTGTGAEIYDFFTKKRLDKR